MGAHSAPTQPLSSISGNPVRPASAMMGMPIEPNATGAVFAKGMVRHGSSQLRDHMGMHTTDLPDGTPHEVIHADDLVVLP